MLALVSAALFALAFLLNVTGAAVPSIISSTNLLLLGLLCLALHQAGIGTATAGSTRSYRFARRR
jgi:hypothetical protein